MAGRVEESLHGSTLYLTIDNPTAMNAMTLDMWETLAAACAGVAGKPEVRAVVIRATGERAFVAGTDINEFRKFDAQRGLRYERRMDEIFATIEAIDVPVIAAINGTCAGGGLLIATCCDVRFAKRGTTFGIPIARSIGNTLSISSLRRVERAIGPGFARQMVFLARMIDAESLLATGFLAGISDDREAFDLAVEQVVASFSKLAPLSHHTIKAALRRAVSGGHDDQDLIETAYGSDDFREGVSAFLEGRPPVWTGI